MYFFLPESKTSTWIAASFCRVATFFLSNTNLVVGYFMCFVILASRVEWVESWVEYGRISEGNIGKSAGNTRKFRSTKCVPCLHYFFHNYLIFN